MALASRKHNGTPTPEKSEPAAASDQTPPAEGGAAATSEGAASEPPAGRKAGREKKERPSRDIGAGVRKLRTWLAQLAWLFCLFCALVLGIGALCIALKANQENSLVTFVLDAADKVDMGIFSRTNGIKEFTGDGAEVKNALLNWGLGAVAWLIVGRIADRILRP